MFEALVKSETFNNTPIGNFPLDWDIVAIGDIATYVGSGITPKGGSNIYKKEGILFIRSQNVTFEGLLLDDVAHIDERIHKIMKRSEVFAHDVLLNITGASIGRCCPLPEGLGKVNVNQHVCAIRLPNPNRENAIFLSSVLASYIGESQINKLNAGGNREGLNYQQLRAFLIPLPPTKERADIAKILDTVDKAIALTDTHITKLKKAKAGLLHDLLTRGIDDHGELRDYRRNPELFKRSPLGKIPKDWSVKTLEELTTKIVDGVHKKPAYKDSGIPFLTVENLTYGSGINFQNVRYISLADHNQFFKRADPKPGDVLVTKDGTLGIARIIPHNSPEFSIFVSLAQLRPNINLAFPSYILTFFETGEYVRQLGHRSAGTGLKHIHLEHFRAFQIATPPLEEQKNIDEKLKVFDKRIRDKEFCREKLKLLKKGLMSDLLTGRVRVKI
ncbi:restriction endonuclease subunit S [Nostoc sp. 'Peltigera malacea cyanobiont' DB3992]|uniref:restriction endonuclease subunit S n=1 Tax=Nostoc sp. 'Peltigera malacea cyanobiont' DB3992 TaxID=1206980 RepID=UPI000C056562|nr:restriction endonuclease subunit S [Nostoc sp. 'Peltigera malacea cyanobiont' DB3992]PHM06894.1 hypothetical protein CK516_30485 [Nostoc sp. 'Peltigera malacea cyanobiont' DB3992]